MIYYGFLYYDKLLDLFQQHTNTNIYIEEIDNNYNITKKYNINLTKNNNTLLNFYIDNIPKKIVYNMPIDLNNLNHYNIKNPIIYAHIQINETELDITEELNKFILNNVSINLDKMKHIWIAYIKNKYNYKHLDTNNFKYKIILANISIYEGDNIEIIIKDNNIKFIT